MSGLQPGFREVEHTADLGFEAWAPDMESLLAVATHALAEICYDRAAVRATERRPLEVAAATAEELLVHWLHEVYLALELDAWLTADVEQVGCRHGRAAGVLVGEPLDRARHALHTEIKAITYHDLAIRRQADGSLRTTVIVDV